MGNLLRLILCFVLFFTFSDTHAQKRRNFRLKQIDPYFQMSFGYSLDLDHENEILRAGLQNGVVSLGFSKRRSPHVYGVEFAVTGRDTNDDKIEEYFNTQNANHLDLIDLTRGSNTLVCLGLRYSYKIEGKKVNWKNGVGGGLCSMQKNEYAMDIYNQLGDEIYKTGAMRVKDDHRAWSGYGPFVSAHSELVFKFRGGFGLVIGANLILAQSILKNEFGQGPYTGTAPIEYENVYYTEKDRMSLLCFYIGFSPGIF